MAQFMTYLASSRNSQRAFTDLCPWRLSDFEWGGISHISSLRQVVKRIEGNDPVVFTAEGDQRRRPEKTKYNVEASEEYLERKRAVQRDYDRRVQGLVRTLRHQCKCAGDSKEETEKEVEGFKEKAARKQELRLVAADSPLFPKNS